LREWAEARLERYKLPDRIHFGTELPLGRTGKADRIRLRANFSSPP
jgi:acyl-coenzyme A synthetase/AMP-(fatty) acid ligase